LLMRTRDRAILIIWALCSVAAQLIAPNYWLAALVALASILLGAVVFARDQSKRVVLLLPAGAHVWKWVERGLEYVFADIKRRNTLKERLHEMYSTGVSLLNTYIPKGTPDPEFRAFVAAQALWTGQSADWVTQNIGLAARARFLQSRTVAINADRAFNPEHNDIIMRLEQLCENLSRLIESGEWERE
jgi:hypothetical protein